MRLTRVVPKDCTEGVGIIRTPQPMSSHHVSPHPSISAVIISCNEADVIEACLESVAGWVDEVVVVDMHSTDGTRDIVRRYTDRLLERDWSPYVEPARNFALDQATGDWIIMLDPDERVPRSLADVLLQIAREDRVDVVAIPRRSVQFGRLVHSPGLADIPQLRFFRRGVLSWPPDVHDRPDVTGLRVQSLAEDREDLYLLHDAWRSIQGVLDRIVRYTPREVDKLQARGEAFSLRAMVRSVQRPVEQQLVNGRAYEDGMPGLLTVLYWCVYFLTVHALYWEAAGQPEEADDMVVRWGRRFSAVYRAARLGLRLWSRGHRVFRRLVRRSDMEGPPAVDAVAWTPRGQG